METLFRRPGGRILKLSENGQSLLDELSRSPQPITTSGKHVKELEYRLLAQASQTHGQTGRHLTELASWQMWQDHGEIAPMTCVSEARSLLEQRAEQIGASRHSLPWPS